MVGGGAARVDALPWSIVRSADLLIGTMRFHFSRRHGPEAIRASASRIRIRAPLVFHSITALDGLWPHNGRPLGDWRR